MLVFYSQPFRIKVLGLIVAIVFAMVESIFTFVTIEDEETNQVRISMLSVDWSQRELYTVEWASGQCRRSLIVASDEG